MRQKTNKLLLLFSDQLFPLEEIHKTGCSAVLFYDLIGCRPKFKFHKLRILASLIASKEYCEQLVDVGYNVHYENFENGKEGSPLSKLSSLIALNKFSEVSYFEIDNIELRCHLDGIRKRSPVSWREFASPMFLCTRESFSQYLADSNGLRMTDFYRFMRIKNNILIDEDQRPVGGKWSFDHENRKRLPRGFELPIQPIGICDEKYSSLKKRVMKDFKENPGEIDNLWIPTNRIDAKVWLRTFFS